MKRKLPRYTTKKIIDGVTMWSYRPPKKAIQASVVSPLDLEASTYLSKKAINTMNSKLDKWKLEILSQQTPTDKSTLHAMCKFYQTTFSFNKLREQTQKDYRNVINNSLHTKIEGVTLGNVRLGNLSRRHIKLAYEKWLERGIRTANISYSILRKIVNVAIEHDILSHNPISNIEKQKEPPRKVMWTPEQVKLFLDTCYSEWKWRNIGLIAHMAYEWSQRTGDMRNLSWVCVCVDKKILTLEQSKRRAEITLPISDNLNNMLIKQKEDFGFQKYVAPSITPYNGSYRPYDITQVSSIANEIKAVCGLPMELHIMDMRRTGITQMVEAGVDITQIMSVSGHQNIQSVTPYIKHTLTASKSAIEKRNIYLDNKKEA